MRASRVVVMVAALVLLTSGCWLEAGANGARSGFNPLESQITAANVSHLGVAWQHQLTGPLDESLVSPTAATAYVPSAGALTSYDLATGTKHWANSSMQTSFQPILSGNQVLVAGPGTASCLLKHVDASTGNVTSTDTFGEPADDLAGAQSVACVPGVPLGTNRIVVPWSQVASTSRNDCSPLPTWRQFTGFASIPGYEIYNELSTVCSGTQPPAPQMNYGEGTGLNGIVITTAGDNTDSVVAVDPDTGQFPWTTFAGGTVNPPVVATPSGDIAYTTTDGNLFVRNGTTGVLKWTAHLDTTLTLPPAATATTIFVATPGGVLDALPVGGCNAATCSPVWHATLASPASVHPSIGGNVVYVGSNDGTVTAFPANGCNASTCSSLWSGATGSKITGAPAIGQGAVVVGSANGTVTAFRLQP